MRKRRRNIRKMSRRNNPILLHIQCSLEHGYLCRLFRWYTKYFSDGYNWRNHLWTVLHNGKVPASRGMKTLGNVPGYEVGEDMSIYEHTYKQTCTVQYILSHRCTDGPLSFLKSAILVYTIHSGVCGQKEENIFPVTPKQFLQQFYVSAMYFIAFTLD